MGVPSTRRSTQSPRLTALVLGEAVESKPLAEELRGEAAGLCITEHALRLAGELFGFAQFTGGGSAGEFRVRDGRPEPERASLSLSLPPTRHRFRSILKGLHRPAQGWRAQRLPWVGCAK